MLAGLTATLLAVSAATAAPAPRFNPAAPENNQHLPSFNYGTVESVLTQVGARFDRRGPANRPALTVLFPNNRRAAILFGSCNPAGSICRSISIQSVWNRPTGAPGERINQLIAQFNQRYAFSRALVTRDGRIALQRYLTADYGFVRGNLAVNLLVFANQADRFSQEVVQPLTSPVR